MKVGLKVPEHRINVLLLVFSRPLLPGTIWYWQISLGWEKFLVVVYWNWKEWNTAVYNQPVHFTHEKAMVPRDKPAYSSACGRPE
jgi:hypothetical protein